MTLSLTARCARTGQFGIAISSSSPAVAARCAWARAKIGAACTQNITDPRLGTVLLDRMAAGESAADAMAAVVTSEPLIAWRQLSAIDREGRTAAWSGEGTLGTHATAEGADCVAAANLLADERVPLEMAAAFAARPDDDLGTRLVAALASGLAAGGEAGPVHSAGLLIVDDVPWPVTDLRVDWSDDPVGDLSSLWRLWRPQAAAYRQRALDPAASPSYGVPGDE
ncbi:MAG: hypothetical protein K0Q71_1140 [Thermomicrobiales bacterium]|nr:hypothetical protein [Thermomicrobiales bacterium]